MDRPNCKCHGIPMGKSGFTPQGKQIWACAIRRRADRREAYWKDPEKWRERARKQHSRKRREQDDYDRRNMLQGRYGISLEEYDQMVMAQCGGCAICGHFESRKKGHLHVDHDHDTGRVRGLICSSCNIGIGNLQDSPQLVANALGYLEEAYHRF